MTRVAAPYGRCSAESRGPAAVLLRPAASEFESRFRRLRRLTCVLSCYNMLTQDECARFLRVPYLGRKASRCRPKAHRTDGRSAAPSPAETPSDASGSCDTPRGSQLPFASKRPRLWDASVSVGAHL